MAFETVPHQEYDDDGVVASKDIVKKKRRSVTLGDIVTIVINGQKKRIYIAEKDYALPKAQKEKVQPTSIDSISPLSPPTRLNSPGGAQVRQPPSLAEQLDGHPVRTMVSLAAGASVEIVAIEKASSTHPTDYEPS